MSFTLTKVCNISGFRQRNPLAKNIFAGISGLSFLYGCYSQISKSNREKLIAFQKEQISKPIYELRDEELVHPPWTENTLQEWLYRPIRVRGRPLHYLGMYVPRMEFGKQGFEYIVPFVTKEDKDQENKEGLLVSLGFIPCEYKEISNRYKLEDASPQTFDCFVSQLPELNNKSFGNVARRQNPEFNYVDLDLMAKYSQFLNQKSMKRVVLERIAMDTVLDERNMRTYDLDADHHMDYPYLKSRSGMLYQKGNMPWDWERSKQQAFGSSLIFGSLSLLIHLAK